MNMGESIDKFKKNKGLYQFTIRSIIFLGILFAIYLGIFLWFRHTEFFINNLRIAEDFYIPWLSGLSKMDFLNAGLFSLVAFIIWNIDSLRKLKQNAINKKETIKFSIIAIGFFIAHYLLKYIIVKNSIESSMLFTILKYGLLIGFVISLMISIYTREFLRKFFGKYKKSIGIFTLVFIIYFFLIQAFQTIWYSLSSFISKIIKWLLSLTFPYVVYNAGNLTTGPRLGIPGFVVSISSACSGTDSLLLFLSLFSILLILDWKRMHLKRMVALFFVGVIGTITYNILRIYSLLLVGIYIDPQFAIDAFHTNAGWMLFLLFFMIYWYFGSKWVYKNSKRNQKRLIKKNAKKDKK